ncbi:MAG: amidohydrolase family protein [Alphaproteobacteria bacterium]|nr:amidohydrolase family protein [Alphaproteobacteria bacterium]
MISNKRTGLVGLAILTFCFVSGFTVQAKDLLVTGGRVVDPATQEIRSENILIRDGKIIATFQGEPEEVEADVFDASGKWIIPGLIDLHVHSYGNQGPNYTFDAPGTAGVANRALYAGVTGFLDLFGDENGLVQLRQEQAKGALGGADIYASLSCLTAPKGHCTEYGIPTRTMTTPDEARAAVADLATKAPNVIKIVYSPDSETPSIDKPTLFAAVGEANKQGLKSVVHIETWQGVRDVIEAGATAVTHVPYEDMPEDIPHLMASHGVVLIPTMTLHTDFAAFMFEPEVLDTPLARSLAASAIIDIYRNEEVLARYNERKQAYAKRTQDTLRKVKAMADAGVTILAGTDAGNWGTIQGYSLHRELMRLVEAGLSPWDALAAATTRAGAFLQQKVGVSANDAASLVVLDSNPIEDIRSTQKITAVIHRGKLVDRAGLLASPQ